MFQPSPFGKYYLLERIAVGGMAEVFRGKLVGAQGVEKEVAVKLVLPQFAKHREFVEMFVEEARLTVLLSHGNVVPVYELGEEAGTLFLAMEYIRGKNLGELLDACVEQDVKVPLALACHVVMEVCKGLDYAHRKTDDDGRPLGIVHRDISPQNALVSYEGDVKIMDFGIARANLRANRTEAGVVKGKCGYMSPEQADGRPLDGRSDTFAAGVLLYECLTLTRLFAEDNDLATLERVKAADIPTPSRINPEIPPPLEAVIFKALARDRDARFLTAGEMADAIARVLFGSHVVPGGPAQLASFTRRMFAAPLAEDEARRRALDEQWAPEMRRHADRVAKGLTGAFQAPEPAAPGSRRVEVRRKARDAAAAVARLKALAGETEDLDEEPPRRMGFVVPVLVLALLAALGFGFRVELQGLADRFQGAKAQANAKPSLGTLLLDTEPQGAKVFIADKLVGTSPVKIGNLDLEQAYEVMFVLEGRTGIRKVGPADWDRSQPEPKLELTHAFGK